jgi:hypothetical protein
VEARRFGVKQGEQAAFQAEQAALDLSRKPILVGRGKGARIVQASDRETLYKAPLFKGIYGFEANADASRWIVYLGGTEYLVYEPAMKRSVRLPGKVPGTALGFSAWIPSQERTVIGEVGLAPVGAHPESEEAETVVRTELFRYDVASGALARIRLPERLRNQPLRVLDSGMLGYLFVSVGGNGATSPRREALVLQVVRASPPRP